MIRITLTVLLLTWTGLCSSESPINVVSYNIRYDAFTDWGARDWDRRKNTVTRYLHKSQASIIGFQEVLHTQLLDVAKALPNYAYIGVGREDGETLGEYSPIFFHQKSWTLDPGDHGTFWLSATPSVAGSRTWGNDFTRICSWARLIGDDGRGLYIYNTHWDHRSQPSREKSAALILEKIQARSYKNDPFILMGDLNATTDDPSIKKLLASGLVIDHGTKQVNTFNHWQPELIPGLRIDHIFTSPSIKKSNIVVESNGKSPGSDHHPVFARISW